MPDATILRFLSYFDKPINRPRQAQGAHPMRLSGQAGWKTAWNMRVRLTSKIKETCVLPCKALASGKQHR
jgi:hypothetical protein